MRIHPSRRPVAIVVLLAASLLCAPGTRSAFAQTSEERNADSSGVVLRIRVVDDLTEEPIAGVWVAAHVGSATPPIARAYSSDNGRLELRVRHDSVDLAVHRIAYHDERLRVQTRSTHRDTIPIELRLVRVILHLDLNDDSTKYELRKPTVVTPCRTQDATASRVADLLRRMIANDPATHGMPDLRAATVEHVVDTARCRDALATIWTYHRSAPDGAQVHLFQLGQHGWAVYEPAKGGYEMMIYILDRDLTRVRRGIAAY